MRLGQRRESREKEQEAEKGARALAKAVNPTSAQESDATSDRKEDEGGGRKILDNFLGLARNIFQPPEASTGWLARPQLGA